MKIFLFLLLSLMMSLAPNASIASNECGDHVTKYDFIFYYKASELEYRPLSTNREVFADIASDIGSVEKSLYQLIKPSRHASGMEIGLIDIPNKGKFTLFDAENRVKQLKFKAETIRDNDIRYKRKHEFENPELFNFLFKSPDPGEKYYYFSANQSERLKWKTSDYLVKGKPVLLSTDFLVVLRPLTTKKTRIEIYEVDPLILAGASYSHSLSTFLPEKGCDWRRNLTPTVQDRLDLLQFIQHANNQPPNDAAIPQHLKADMALRKLVNESQVQIKNLKVEKNKIKLGELIRLTFEIYNNSDTNLSASLISNYYVDNPSFFIDYRLSIGDRPYIGLIEPCSTLHVAPLCQSDSSGLTDHCSRLRAAKSCQDEPWSARNGNYVPNSRMNHSFQINTQSHMTLNDSIPSKEIQAGSYTLHVYLRSKWLQNKEAGQDNAISELIVPISIEK